MENINTTITPLPKASGLPEKQKKAATILGIIILAGTVLATLIDCIYNVSYSIDMYDDFFYALVFNSSYIIGSLIGIIPNILFSVYLLAFYKKNPAHATIKISYILCILLLGIIMFTKHIPFITSLSNYNYDQLPSSYLISNVNSLSYDILTCICSIVFCIVAFSRFKSYQLARIFRTVLMVAYITARVILYSSLDTISEFVFFSYTVLWIAAHAAEVAFWFICIDKATPYHIPEKKKPVSYPAYNLPTPQIVIQPVVQPMPQQPVQPVVPPVYQPPVQPVAPPVYQPTVQPTAAPASDDDVEAKLLKINHLLKTGLITQDEYDKKKAEILNRI